MSKSSYAQFNTLTITGRLSHAELVDGQYGEFLAVTLLTELVDEAAAVAVQFNTTNGLMSLYKKGWLNNGRRVTVTGHLESFTELYLDKKTGKRRMLQRPRLQLSKAVVFDGGLGPAKREEVAEIDGDVEIDETPALPKQPAVAVTPSGEDVEF
jgi:hypothetical protein